MIRTKFVVEEKKEMGDSFDIVFSAVVEDSKENQEFFNDTSDSQIELNIVKPEVAERFIEGREYFVDFSIAPEKELPVE